MALIRTIGHLLLSSDSVDSGLASKVCAVGAWLGILVRSRVVCVPPFIACAKPAVLSVRIIVIKFLPYHSCGQRMCATVPSAVQLFCELPSLRRLGTTMPFFGEREASELRAAADGVKAAVGEHTPEEERVDHALQQLLALML